MTSWQIIEGDCIEKMRELDAESIDCVITDPPYGMAFQSSWRIERERFAAIANDGDFDPEWQGAWMRECYRLLRPDSHFYFFCSDHHIGRFRDLAADVGFTVKRTLVWWKRGGGMGDLEGDYAHETEFIIFAHKGRRNLGGGRRSNVFEVPKVPNAQIAHPTEKPVGIVRELLARSTKAGDTVLDPFMGSGTTLVAAQEEGRSSVGIEVNPAYCGVARARLAQDSLFSVAA